MISVCMATYNGSRFVKQQIQSVLRQLGPGDEVVISDDSSTDNTVTIIRSFGDPRIRIFTNTFKNVVLNFEFALSRATGDYIFLCDQDDVWLSDKVKRMLEALQSCDLVVSNCQFMHEDGTLYTDTKSFFALYSSGPGLLKNLLKNTYLGNCMAFRKQVLQYALPFPVAISRFPNLDHGYWVGIIANTCFRVTFIPDVLVHYRRHSNNVSPTNPDAVSPFSLYVKLRARVYLISALLTHISQKIFR